MADQTSPIQQIAPGSNAVDRVNENFDAASPALLWGRDARSTAGLNWGYVGGRWGGAVIANGAVLLVASSTNYVVADLSSGTVSASTTTANWSDQENYVRLYKVVTGSMSITDYEDHRQLYGQGGGIASSTPIVIPVACSDETTALTSGSAKVTFRMPIAITLQAVRASLTTAQTSGSVLTVDINAAGTSILSTKLTIDNSEKTSKTAATPAVISNTALVDDVEITVDVDQVGDGTAAGLKVYLVGAPA